MDKGILAVLLWLFFLGGLFGMAMGMAKFFGGGSPAEYGVMGIGGGFYMMCAALVVLIRKRTTGI
jgi:hypothetical protein